MSSLLPLPAYSLWWCLPTRRLRRIERTQQLRPSRAWPPATGPVRALARRSSLRPSLAVVYLDLDLPQMDQQSRAGHGARISTSAARRRSATSGSRSAAAWTKCSARTWPAMSSNSCSRDRFPTRTAPRRRRCWRDLAERGVSALHRPCLHHRLQFVPPEPGCRRLAEAACRQTRRAAAGAPWLPVRTLQTVPGCAPESTDLLETALQRLDQSASYHLPRNRCTHEPPGPLTDATLGSQPTSPVRSGKTHGALLRSFTLCSSPGAGPRHRYRHMYLTLPELPVPPASAARHMVLTYESFPGWTPTLKRPFRSELVHRASVEFHTWCVLFPASAGTRA